MQNFDIVKKTKCKETFRVKSVIDKFDLDSSAVQETFTGAIDLPNEWSIGLIVGASGTGKSTIINDVFNVTPDNTPEYNSDAVVNDMPKNSSTSDIHKMFNSVGFSSPPSWLKPYAVLSNGEKMRVDLAYSLLQDEKLIIFDEFTSVVDRQVAKIGSYAVQKNVRKTNKQFIAVGCHYDVEEWLMPDWVFDTNTMKMKYNERRLLRRPDIKFRVYETKQKKEFWNMFGRYHYLNHSMNNACIMFVLTVDDVPCGMCSVLHFPHPKVKNMKKEHRLVIHPDFQGIGLGGRLSESVGHILKERGYRFNSVTSNPALSAQRSKSNNWNLARQGRLPPASNRSGIKKLNKTTSKNRITMTWSYCGE